VISGINGLGELVEMNYDSGAYTVSIVKNEQILKAVTNSFELAKEGFEFYLGRNRDQGRGSVRFISHSPSEVYFKLGEITKRSTDPSYCVSAREDIAFLISEIKSTPPGSLYESSRLMKKTLSNCDCYICGNKKTDPVQERLNNAALDLLGALRVVRDERLAIGSPLYKMATRAIDKAEGREMKSYPF
jgi:hypothetical protein